MPIPKRCDHDFFDVWTPEMAYVLGFFAADGNMIMGKQGAKYIGFYSNDRQLLVHVRSCLRSGHKVSGRKRNGRKHTEYRLQIGSRQLYDRLVQLGFSPNKSKTLQLMHIPKRYMSKFVLGYFDGDGNVYFKQHFAKDRQKKRWVFSSRFTCGSKGFLVDLLRVLRRNRIKGGHIQTKSRNSGFELCLSHRDSIALYRFMYHNAAPNTFCLPRKHKLFSKAIRTLYGQDAGVAQLV